VTDKTIGVTRRNFVGLAAAAMAWPLGGRAQTVPRVGYLLPGTVASHGAYVPTMLKGLAEAGLSEGTGFTLDLRYAEGKPDRYAALIGGMIEANAQVLVIGSTAAGLVAKRATSTVPIVVAAGDDPVVQGLVASVSRPGGNVTAVALFSVELIGKRLGLLAELAPSEKVAGLLVNPSNPSARPAASATQAAGQQVGREVVGVGASSDDEIDKAFATLAERGAKLLLSDSDPFLNSRRERIVALANKAGMIANYPLREYVAVGGLSSYGVDYADAYRQAGAYAGKILKGARVAELPVLQPAKFQMALNLKVAKALGLTVPPAVLANADEVVE
jgi:putative tryptophan/tyrosine transport system substrate-binding protein